jgi:hypothetical protein
MGADGEARVSNVPVHHSEATNLAAYVCGIDNLRVEPYKLPSVLGLSLNSEPCIVLISVASNAKL